MSARYLLPCPECGKSIPVEGGRAGGTATCSCGKTIEVPRVGILRTFAQEGVASVAPITGSKPVSTSSSNWGVAQGLMLLGALLILAGGIPALYKTYTFPPRPFQTQEQIHEYADDYFDNMSLTDSWNFWKRFIEPQGLTREPTPHEAAYDRMAADLRQWISIFITIAIVGLILAIVGFVALATSVRR